MSKVRHQATNAVGEMAKQVAEVAEDKVAEARKGLDEAVEHGRELYSELRASALEGAKAAGQFIREKPYAAAGIGLGLGMLIGLLLRGRGRRS
jgi:ElaB/YqjD/DUF883 family membrane-anchored ribosome-binding protein